jgi:S1-C subfamily serine protease
MRKATLLVLGVSLLICASRLNDQQRAIDTLEDKIGQIDWKFNLEVLKSCGIITNDSRFGSCVAIRSDLILTAGHCIGHPDSHVEIGGVQYEILDEWKSDKYDVGFVRISKELPFVELGDMPDLLAEVYLVSTPYYYCYVNSVTKGVISSLNRDVGKWKGVIQVDAASSSGSSGGALFGAECKLIGILIAAPAGSECTGLCIPTMQILEALADYDAIQK